MYISIFFIYRFHELYRVFRRFGFRDQQRTRYNFSIMNTSQLECCVKCDVLRDTVLGIFASDRLPIHRPYGVIVNTDKHTQLGTNWCVLSTMMVKDM